MSEEKVRINLRLSEDEKEKLEHCAALCGLSQAEFLRQICKGKAPKPVPTQSFWELMNALYEVHNGFKKCAKYESFALEICKEIECLIIDLQSKMTVPREIA